MTQAVSKTPAPPVQPPGTAGYEFQRPQGVCAVTGQTIEPGARMMAALRETPAGFERVDVSVDAWEQFTDRSQIIAFWQTAMPTPAQAPKRVFVDDEVLADLFERLSSTTEPSKLSFRFVLGLILMRKKLLAYESSHVNADHQEVWLMKPKGREARLELVNPHLTEEQVNQVSQQLGQILNEDL